MVTSLNILNTAQSLDMQGIVVDVLLTITIHTLEQKVFSYCLPSFVDGSQVTVGLAVLVPFGRQQGVTGFIVNIRHHSGEPTTEKPYPLKPVTEILDENPLFNPAYYAFASWVAQYYVTPVSQVLACALPANLVQKPKKQILPGAGFYDPEQRACLKPAMVPIAFKLINFFHEKLTDASSPNAKKTHIAYTLRYLSGVAGCPAKSLNKIIAALVSLDILQVQSDLSLKTRPKMTQFVFPVMTLPGQDSQNKSSLSVLSKPACELPSERLSQLTVRQQNLLSALAAYPDGLPLATALTTFKTTRETLHKLEALGFLRFELKPVMRDPTAYFTRLFQETPTLHLSPHQTQVVQTIRQGDSQNPYLLYGVTGSGKTEVYISLTRETLLAGESVLILLPEIALTSQIARRFIQHFGADNIALWHSNLSDGEKADTWHQLQNGQLRVVIGARSAIWAPVQNLGLIVIDEEHETSFKQDAPMPRYNAKTLAMELSRQTGAKLVLGSATPEISSYYHALAHNRILRLTERFGGKPLASVELVDMKQEWASRGRRGQLSLALQEALIQNVAAGNQSVILLNRRGYYTLIQCLNCDYTFQCPHCEVALTYHRPKDRVCCHYCGYENSLPQYCPVCTSMELVNSGVGTQRIEAEIAKLLPNARLLRLDSDVLKRKHAYREIFEAFSSGEADVLIGTQVVAKGLDVANVTLVGVINADAAFALPDYKSLEKGFQLLTQVAGRAGRGEKPGRVIVQSCQLEHMVLKHSQNQDYESFYQEEIANRQQMGFPPFSQLFRLVVTAENDKKALQYLSTAVLHLQEQVKKNPVLTLAILGPAPCVLPKLQGRYRYHALIKNFSGAAGHQLITTVYETLMKGYRPEDISCLLDIDAYSLL